MSTTRTGERRATSRRNREDVRWYWLCQVAVLIMAIAVVALEVEGNSLVGRVLGVATVLLIVAMIRIDRRPPR